MLTELKKNTHTNSLDEIRSSQLPSIRIPLALLLFIAIRLYEVNFDDRKIN